jgi:hypothetical protein
MAERVPTERHVPFIVDLWIHNASYTTGFVGGFIVIASTLMSRHWREQLYD